MKQNQLKIQKRVHFSDEQDVLFQKRLKEEKESENMEPESMILLKKTSAVQSELMNMVQKNLDEESSSQHTLDLTGLCSGQISPHVLPELHSSQTKKSTILSEQSDYGTLIVLGKGNYQFVSDSQISGIGPSNQIFPLGLREQASGLKQTSQATVIQNSSTLRSNRPNIKFTFPDQIFLLEFEPDLATDMFQLGRSDHNQICLNGMSTPKGPILSRYALRIVCERMTRKTKIFAGGFDEHGQLMIGSSTLCWKEPKLDGFTVNGVKICPIEKKIWAEISIFGDAFELRAPSEFRKMPKRLEDETNLLKDNTLINVGGLTLLWKQSPPSTSWSLNQLFELWRKEAIPIANVNTNNSHFSVFRECGHLVLCKESEIQLCPMCQLKSNLIRLNVCESLLPFLSENMPTHFFLPCGHVIDEGGADMWSSVLQPAISELTQLPRSHCCPFCRLQLAEKPFLKIRLKNK